MSVLLDTDIVIEILRLRDQGILTAWTALAVTSPNIFLTPVTAAEVWAGVRPREHRAAEQFLSSLTCVSVDYEIGHIAGDCLRQFSKSHNLKIGDALIAAAAIRHKAALWTRNRKHYPMPQLTFFA
jgi:hypothetical protein